MTALPNPRPHLLPLVVAVTVAALVAGCGAAAPVLRIVITIGQSVLVTAGQEYLEKVVSRRDSTDRPTITIEYVDAQQNPSTAVYVVDVANRISISGVQGEVQISGDCRNHTVRVVPPSTATIEILGDDDAPAPCATTPTVPSVAATGRDAYAEQMCLNMREITAGSGGSVPDLDLLEQIIYKGLSSTDPSIAAPSRRLDESVRTVRATNDAKDLGPVRTAVDALLAACTAGGY